MRRSLLPLHVHVSSYRYSCTVDQLAGNSQRGNATTRIAKRFLLELERLERKRRRGVGGVYLADTELWRWVLKLGRKGRRAAAKKRKSGHDGARGRRWWAAGFHMRAGADKSDRLGEQTPWTHFASSTPASWASRWIRGIQRLSDSDRARTANPKVGPSRLSQRHDSRAQVCRVLSSAGCGHSSPGEQRLCKLTRLAPSSLVA